MKIIIIIGNIIIGLVQFAAMLNGLNDKLGKFFGTIVSLILGQIPIVGTILGIRGAIVYWGWEVWQAILLFIGPVVLIFILGLAKKNPI